MAEQIEMPLEEHDRLIAYVLGLSHALNIAFFTALAESGEAAPRLADLSSTTFDAQLDVAALVARESPQLYFEIQKLNPHGLHALEELLHSVQRLTEIVRAGDEPAFVRLMEQGRSYLARRTES
jgi:chorismate mutase/prephenate dehydrogenase